MSTLYLDLAETGPFFVNLGDVSADVAIVDDPAVDDPPAYVIRRTWVIDPSNPEDPNLLNGKTVKRTWEWNGEPQYFVGSDVAAPVPDMHWDGLVTAKIGGVAEATLAGVSDVDPFLLVLASK